MLRPDRLAATARGRSKSLITAGSKRAGAMRGSHKSLALAGTALALVGAGSATVAGTAMADGPPARPLTAQAYHAAPAHRPGPPVARPSQTGAPIASLVGGATPRPAPSHAPASHPAALTWAEVRDAISRQTSPPAVPPGEAGSADQLMPVRTSGPQARSGIRRVTPRGQGSRSGPTLRPSRTRLSRSPTPSGNRKPPRWYGTSRCTRSRGS